MSFVAGYYNNKPEVTFFAKFVCTTSFKPFENGDSATFAELQSVMVQVWPCKCAFRNLHVTYVIPQGWWLSQPQPLKLYDVSAYQSFYNLLDLRIVKMSPLDRRFVIELWELSGCEHFAVSARKIPYHGL